MRSLQSRCPAPATSLGAPTYTPCQTTRWICCASCTPCSRRARKEGGGGGGAGVGARGPAQHTSGVCRPGAWRAQACSSCPGRLLLSNGLATTFPPSGCLSCASALPHVRCFPLTLSSSAAHVRPRPADVGGPAAAKMPGGAAQRRPPARLLGAHSGPQGVHGGGGGMCEGGVGAAPRACWRTWRALCCCGPDAHAR
jgi:hypothetical protein